MKQEIAVGKTVRVLNCTYSGTLIIEGEARITKIFSVEESGTAARCLVRFAGVMGKGVGYAERPVERIVEMDPEEVLEHSKRVAENQR